MTLCHYRQVWAVDFEFTAPSGERPRPLCCVARELKTGEVKRLWLEGSSPSIPPYTTGPDTLVVAYYSSAEWGCHLALDWPMPARVLDLYVEFRCLTSGKTVPCGRGLVGALSYFGLDGLAVIEKEEMRQLAMRGGTYNAKEQGALLDYCQRDVDALARLLPSMQPHIDLPRALVRGRYMIAAARMEWVGVPIDLDSLNRLRNGWDQITGRLIASVDADYGVFVPAGQRIINPDSPLGAAILREASDWDIDPYQLADAVDEVWRTERESTAEIHGARRAARQATGLTARRIEQYENAGRDPAHYRGLDILARELAASYPALGIGPGYTTGGGYDGIDYAARLWDTLRNHDEQQKPRHHPTILRRAAELVSSCAGGVQPAGPMTFSAKKWGDYLARQGIPWPQLPSGEMALDDDTFREMARAYPVQVSPIRELRHALSQMRLNELAVGSDGRNRVLLSVFGSRTGRNQPSNSRFIFGPATWLRSLIQPAPGRAVAYIDWSQQELAIAAALSGDERMQNAYVSGDFYLTFAKMAGAVPPDATKKSHSVEREQFKTVALGVLYGLSADGLARKLGIPPCQGRELLEMHRRTFRRFWEWSDRVEMEATLGGRLRTVYGWTVHAGPDVNPRSMRNFPMQAHGAEMMRFACCLATEREILVCAPVHDALLIEASTEGINDAVARTQQAMREASELVLPGFPLRTEAKVVRHPERYIDERGRRMWETVVRLLDELDAAERQGIAGDTL